MFKLATGVLALSLLAVPALAENDGTITVTKGDVTATINNGGAMSQTYGGINVGNVTASLSFTPGLLLATPDSGIDAVPLSLAPFSLTTVGVHTYYETGFVADFDPINLDISDTGPEEITLEPQELDEDEQEVITFDDIVVGVLITDPAFTD
ncbi:MAG: hypothetical protein WDZ54_02900 [Sneathiella sp.]